MSSPSLAGVAKKVGNALEGASWLDAIADRISSAVPDRLRTGRLRDAASGTPIGHPAHPGLVVVPMGAWISASVLDMFGGRGSRTASSRLIGVGLVAAAPTAITGWSDWLDTEGAERRVGLVHAAANSAAISLYLASWVERRRGSNRSGVGLALAGAGALSAAGWLGGHLAYALGVGVDTTAFQHLATDWVDVGPAAQLERDGARLVTEVSGTPVLVVRTSAGLAAIADRCTHRGAPLHEGELRGDCVVCPWHESVFSLATGNVEQGPATRPQPVYEVREDSGQLQLRRTELRALRTNPV